MVPRVSSNSSALLGELFGLYGGRLTRSIKSLGLEVDVVDSGEPVSKKRRFSAFDTSVGCYSSMKKVVKSNCVSGEIH